ncbi:hypothetical protein [Gaoshiqia sp. Z1-71]|uniref:hypothetical protein n=1 Tax=Gaoshiqia hydrogeniformans TaxID=3290090 RepID=UPI003BF7D34B
MKKSAIILSIVCLSFGFFSCKDDEKDFETIVDKESIAQSLQLFIDKNNIRDAFVYESKWNDDQKTYEWVLYSHLSAEFEMIGSIIRAGSIYYNLEYLQKFNLFGSTIMRLYFKVDQ